MIATIRQATEAVEQAAMRVAELQAQVNHAANVLTYKRQELYTAIEAETGHRP